MEASAVRCAVCSYLTNVNDGALRFQDSVIDSPFTDKREKGENKWERQQKQQTQRTQKESRPERKA